MKVTEELKEMIENSEMVVVLTDAGELRISFEGVMIDVLSALQSAIIELHLREGSSEDYFNTAMDKTKDYYKERNNESKDCL